MRLSKLKYNFKEQRIIYNDAMYVFAEKESYYMI